MSIQQILTEEASPVAESPGSSRNALVLPGAGYTTLGPMLLWPIRILKDQGFTIHRIAWTIDVEDRDEPKRLINQACELAQEHIGGSPDVVLAKSFGTRALPNFAEADIPGIWLTPLLHEVELRASARQLDERNLLIGGTWIPHGIH